MQYLSGQQVKDPKIWWRLLREEQLIAQVWAYRREREWHRAMLATLVLLRHHSRRFVRRLRALISSAHSTLQ